MRSSTPTQFQSTRSSISSSTTHSNSAAFGPSMPEARLTSYQQRPSYLAPRPQLAQYETPQYPKLGHEYGRPPPTVSYAAPPPPVFSNDSPVTTTKHKSGWLEEARESTTNFKKNGSPVPLVWVRVVSIEVRMVAKRSQRSLSRINPFHQTLFLLAKIAMDRRCSLHVLIWR